MTISRSTPYSRFALVLTLAAAWMLALTPDGASANVATALVREGKPIAGAPPASLVSSINNTAVNQVGGYAINVNTDDGLSRIWGNAAGGPGTLLRTEGTFGSLVQTSFESFYGMADGGQLSYSASGTGGPVGGFDSVWLDDTPIAVEGDPIPTLPGNYWRFASRPGVTASGIPYWIGGTTTTPGGTTLNRGLFYGAGATVLLLGGQTPPGLPFPITTTGGPSFDYRISALGTHSIVPLTIQSGSTLNDDAMVYDGAALVVGGDIVREQKPVPAVAGGLPGENWDNFDFCGATESGEWFFTGDTEPATANDEIIVKNGAIAYREGDALDGEVLSGTISGAYINEQGDLAFIWQIQNATKRALYVNDQLIVKQGDPVDLNGDGIVEPTSILSAFTGISSLTLGPRNLAGDVNAYFVADVDTAGTSSTTDDVGAFFCITTNVAPPIAVTLESFTATAVSGGVRLEWATSRETEHDGFYVYRSGDAAGSWERLTADLVRGQSPYAWVDASAEPGREYHYRLGAVDARGREEMLGLVTVTAGVRLATVLRGGAPNPFADATQVRFALAQGGTARLAVYDARGRLVRRLVDQVLPAGEHMARWDGRDEAGRSVAGGMYVARLEAGGRTQAEKMLLLRP